MKYQKDLKLLFLLKNVKIFLENVIFHQKQNKTKNDLGGLRPKF